MNKIYHNAIRGCVLGFGLLLGLSSCSDDHFDINSASGSAKNTIWQNIEADPELTSLAKIMKRTVNISDEYDNHATITFDQYLDRPLSLTMWAPVDGTYDAQKYLDMLDEVDALYAAGKTLEAKRLAVQVANIFAKNHLANYNYETSTGLQKVRLLNGKLVNYDASNMTFNGATIDAEGANVVSSNGMIHKIIGESRFANNIRDFIEYDEERFDSLRTMLKSYETRTFNPDASVTGSMDPDGNMVYADSVYVTNNPVENLAFVQSSNEDSLYIAILPTNAAWKQAKAVSQSLYNYKGGATEVVKGVTTYPYRANWKDRDFSETIYGLSHADYVLNSAKSGADKIEPTFDIDSISSLNANTTLYGSMFVSPSIFNNVNKNDSASLINYVLRADSLICPSGSVIYNSNKGGVNPIFAGQTPMKASNGYVFAMSDYSTIDPSYTFLGHYEIPAYVESNVLYQSGNEADIPNIELTANNKNPDMPDVVPNNTYKRFRGVGLNSQVPLIINFALPALRSGHYRVSIEIVPNYMVTSYSPEPEDAGPARFTASIKYDDGTNVEGSPEGKKFSLSDPNRVERIVLAEDIEFKKSYSGLPSGYESYPYLQLQMSASDQYNYTDAISICRILVEPVR